MTGRLGVGIVGCGNIAATYLRNAALFPGLRVLACADQRPEAAAARAAEFGLRALSVEALLDDPSIALVVNLTIPSAHREVTTAALRAGKHVYTEKPLGTTSAEARELVALAAERGLALASAPDTFLGAAGRAARRLVDEGAIGSVVAGTAFMMGHGMEHWHPAPAFYYQPGGGPALDMGPYYVAALCNLLGPVRRVMGVASVGAPERVITAPGPTFGDRFAVATQTTAFGVLDFVTGANVAIGMSWDAWRHSSAPIELHGTEGSLRLPDPDTYGGALEISRHGGPWEAIATDADPFGAANWPFEGPRIANYRGLAVAEMARALAEGGAPRTEAGFALHVLEVLEGLAVSSATDSAVRPGTPTDRPAAMSDAQARSLVEASEA